MRCSWNIRIYQLAESMNVHKSSNNISLACVCQWTFMGYQKPKTKLRTALTTLPFIIQFSSQDNTVSFPKVSVDFWPDYMHNVSEDSSLHYPYSHDLVLSTEETTLIGHISAVVRSGRGSDFVAQKERGSVMAMQCNFNRLQLIFFTNN